MALAKSLTSTFTGELPMLRTGYAIVYGIDYVIGFAIRHTIEKVKMLSLNRLLHFVVFSGISRSTKQKWSYPYTVTKPSYQLMLRGV